MVGRVMVQIDVDLKRIPFDAAENPPARLAFANVFVFEQPDFAQIFMDSRRGCADGGRHDEPVPRD